MEVSQIVVLIAISPLVIVIVGVLLLKRNTPNTNKEEDEEKDKIDRTVYLVETEFETVLGEKVVFLSRWVRLNSFLNGLKSYQKLFVLNSTIEAEGKTYRGKHIVSAKSKIVGTAYVREDVKRRMDGYRTSDWSEWELTRYHDGDEVEDIEMF